MQQQKVTLDRFNVKRELRNTGRKTLELAAELHLTYQGLLYRFDRQWDKSEAQKVADFIGVDLSKLTVDTDN